MPLSDEGAAPLTRSARLGFAERQGAEVALAALIEGREPGTEVPRGEAVLVHAFALAGLEGLLLRSAIALRIRCRPRADILIAGVAGGLLVDEEVLPVAAARSIPSGRDLDLGIGAGGCILVLGGGRGGADVLTGVVAALGALLLAAAPAPREEGSTAGSPTVPRHVKRAEDYMARHLAEPLTIGDLAAHVGASPRSLNRAFLRFRGVTPSRHLQNLRAEAAQRLLAADDCLLDLREVALRVGFGSYAPFWRAYVRRFGRPPSSGRRRGDGLSSTPE